MALGAEFSQHSTAQHSTAQHSALSVFFAYLNMDR